MNDLSNPVTADEIERLIRQNHNSVTERRGAAQDLLAAIRERGIEPEDKHPVDDRRPVKPIPINAGKRIAVTYGYDQVIVLGRRITPGAEHLTTYGVTVEHCSAAAKIGATLKRFMGWKE